jgi:hypothetical protein
MGPCFRRGDELEKSGEQSDLWPATAAVGSLQQRSSVPFEGHQRAHGHVHGAQLGGSAEVWQVDDEAGRDHVGADLAQQFGRDLRN